MRFVAIFPLLLAYCQALKVLKSMLELTDFKRYISGAKLIPESTNVSIQSITLCIRFNLKYLGSYEERSRLITIEDWRQVNVELILL